MFQIAYKIGPNKREKRAPERERDRQREGEILGRFWQPHLN